MTVGYQVKPGSFWIGAHWSEHNRRLCINLIPCVTIWVVLKGGKFPRSYRLAFARALQQKIVKHGQMETD